MLTREEQEQVMNKVRFLLRADSEWKTKVRNGQLSERQRKVSRAKALDEFADMLKEIG